MMVVKEFVEKYYDVYKDKLFFFSLIEFIIFGFVVVMVWEGEGVVVFVRKIIGVINFLIVEFGIICGDYGISVGCNLIYGFDGIENVKKEISFWFIEEDLVLWKFCLIIWIVEKDS